MNTRTASTVRGLIVATVIAALLSLSGTSPAGATGPSSPMALADQQEAFSLGISPTRLEVTDANLGEPQTVQVSNSGTDPLHVLVQKQSFTGAPDGSMTFAPTAPYSAANWVTVTPAEFTLAPGATRAVSATVDIPADPEPGDHQVGLVFLVPAGAGSGNIKINRGIAVPLYVTVPGPTDDSVSLSDLSAPWFVTGGSVTVTATVHDTGNVHRDFRDESPLELTGAGSAAAFPDFTVMRESTRDITTTWDPPFLCICHPTVTLHSASGTTTKSVRVIVFPLPLAGMLLAGLLIGWALLRLARSRYRASVVRAAAALGPVIGHPHVRP